MIEEAGRVSRVDLATEQMPEVHRELTMLRGALEDVRRRADDIVAKTMSVQRNIPEEKTDNMPVDLMPVTTEVGKHLRDMTEECSQIASILARAENKIEL
jgi:hypothetical protein